MNPSPAIGNTKSGNNAGDAVLWAAGRTETMYYVHKDYASATLSTGLGSISAITDATGNLLESLSYDACSVKLGFCEHSETKALIEPISLHAMQREGGRRKPTNWTDYNVTSTLFDRGFTGHEHLQQFGLINMNGRVYDPFLARFLSPDPFVQAPGYTQNYNRYSYAWNNPLKYTDPSGYYVNPNPDEGIPRRHMDGGSGATFAPNSFANNWYAWATKPTAMTAHHHSNAHRSEAMNALFISSSAYNSLYGQGASRLIYDVWQDPDARARWLSGQASLSKGMWVSDWEVEKFTVRGSMKGASYTFTGGPVAINRFVKFQGTSGRVDGSNSFLNRVNNFNTWFGAGLYGVDKTLSVTQTGRNIGYGLAYTPIVRVTNFIKPLGYGTSFVGFGIGIARFAISDYSWGDYGQLGVSFLSSGLTISPYTAPFGIAIGVVDMFDGFNGFYNYLDNQEQFYNSTGGLILQINQYPVFIPITRP